VSNLSLVQTCIPSIGRLHRLGLCWQNLLNHDNVHPNRRMLIVASKTYQVLAPWRQADICFLQTKHWTQGMAYAACVDLSLEDETWEYLLLVEDDIRCFPGVVQGMLDLMKTDPKIGMVTPWGGFRGIGNVRDVVTSKGMLLIRREVFDSAGNFYHEMPMHAETEFAIRLHLAGYTFKCLSFKEGLKHRKLPYGGCADRIGGQFNTMDQRGRELARRVIAHEYMNHSWIRTMPKTGSVHIMRKMIAPIVANGKARQLLDVISYRRRKQRGYTKADLADATWL
jgi:hypothetical protein